MNEKMLELKKELAEKDEHIMELEKINYQTQKKLAEAQKKVLEMENKTEGIDISPTKITQSAEIKELKLKIKRRDDILKNIKKKMEILKKKPVSKTDQKQLEVMKQAISKIKSLQSELVEKKSKISEIRKEVEKNKDKMKLELEKKDEMIKNQSAEIDKLENEFVSFKEEFVDELKNIERQKETISMKQLLDSKKDLEIEQDKFQEIIADKNDLLKNRDEDIKGLKMMLKTRDKKIGELEEKVDKLLLSDESTKTLQSKIKSLEDEYNEKLRIRVEELEKTREEIILISSELAACPNLSSDEILECVDDIMLISPENRYQKIQEIIAAKEAEGTEVTEEELSAEEASIEEITEEIVEEKEVTPTEESKSEELELRSLIVKEIPNLSNVEMEIFLQELLTTHPDDRKSKIELFKMTKELEDFKKST
ncbi:MAG: hypothetical protein HWN67_05530 [Candidatus Helarchaeota archaeon]|nr:hypothetical protein [Candidatus Helarchaeota archaeon]